MEANIKSLSATAEGKKLLKAYNDLDADSFKVRKSAKEALLQNVNSVVPLLLKGRLEKDKIETQQNCVDIINKVGSKQLMLGAEVFGNSLHIVPLEKIHDGGDGCPACGLGYIPSHSVDFINAFSKL